MPSIQSITIHLHDAHYASYVPLDSREIRRILGCMVDYLLISERGFEDLCCGQDALLLQGLVAVGKQPPSPQAISENACAPLIRIADSCADSIPCTAQLAQSFSEQRASPFSEQRASPCSEQLAPSFSEQRASLCTVKPLSATFSGELSLTFVRDGAMYATNKEYMDCASPTNILSFPLYTSPKEGILVPPLGDMVLSVDTVRREAFIYGQEPTDYAIRLLAHAMAHMTGFDHGEPMWALEQALLGYALSRI